MAIRVTYVAPELLIVWQQRFANERVPKGRGMVLLQWSVSSPVQTRYAASTILIIRASRLHELLPWECKLLRPVDKTADQQAV